MEQRILNGESISNLEVTIPSYNHTQKGLFSGSPIFNENGKVTGITVAIEDITERILVTEQLKLIEEAINVVQEVLWIKKTKPITHNTFISKAIAKISGYPPETFYHNNNLWFSLVCSDDISKLESFYKLTDFSHDYIEYRILDKNNKIKWLSERKYNTSNSGIMFSIINDISSQKEHEELRLILEEVLTKFDDDIWLLEFFPETNIYKYLYMSESVEKIFGYPATAFFDNPNLWYELIYPKDINKVEKAFTSNSTPAYVTYRIVTPNKKIKHIKEKFIKYIKNNRTFIMGISFEYKTTV